MTDSPQRANLGRGLAALFGEQSDDYASLDKLRAAKEVPVAHLHPNRHQPRSLFDDEAIIELARSIKANGVIQPIVVRPHPQRPQEFEIIAGERRWRAAQKAQLHDVPVVIRDLEDGQMLELALVENLQRQDLTALEEAEGYRHLMDHFGHTQDTVSRGLGKSRSHVANTLRLLNLPPQVKDLLQSGALSAGHARALLGAEAPEAVALQVVARGLNVRQTERLAKAPAARRKAKAGGKPATKDPDTLALEHDLSTVLGLKATVQFHGQAGSITVHYQTLEQLDDLLDRLTQKRDKEEA